ncbi:hypothetical protein [Sphingobacterium sp.]|uniref:hypothetical protein n=1 Tax=Sphingobacterium sp. TaxID=341027 RepID=UPI0031D6941A
MYKVRIHRKNSTTRNPHGLVAVMIGTEGDLSAFKRVFKHRGIDSDWLTEREMTESERFKSTISWRLQTYVYSNWKELIEDEWLITHDMAWIKELLQISKLSISIDDLIKNAPKK